MSLLRRWGATGMLLLALMIPAQAAFATSLDDLGSNEEDSVSIDQFLEERTKETQGELQDSLEKSVPEQGTPEVNLPDSNPGDVGDFLNGFTPVTKEGLGSANKLLSTPLSWLSIFISGVIIVTIAFLFFTTSLDLLYILVPFTRRWLADASQNGAGQQMAGVGFGGMQGGYAAGMNGGGNFIQRVFNGNWVSDEAIKVVSLYGGGAPAQGQAMASPYGGPMMTPQQNQNQAKGTVLGKYMKLRIWTMFLFGIAIVLLTSSIFTDWGMNIGGMIITLITENWPW